MIANHAVLDSHCKTIQSHIKYKWQQLREAAMVQWREDRLGPRGLGWYPWYEFLNDSVKSPKSFCSQFPHP